LFICAYFIFGLWAVNFTITIVTASEDDTETHYPTRNFHITRLTLRSLYVGALNSEQCVPPYAAGQEKTQGERW
jgi:hypothetical protein